MTDSVILSMSLSGSLYRSYALLYDRFSTGLFTFDELRSVLGLGLQMGLKHASVLRSKGYLTVFGRKGRTRLYRLLAPEQALFAHIAMKNLAVLKQQRYLHLIVDVCIQLHKRKELGLAGVWLFGSVARGTARDNSDVDLIVVAKGLSGSRAEMSDAVYSALSITEERQFLYENGFATDASIYPMAEGELGRFYPLLLDVVDHGIVVYEMDARLSRAAESMRLGASRLGVKRVDLGKGWAWTLPPGLRVGEPLEIRETV